MPAVAGKWRRVETLLLLAIGARARYISRGFYEAQARRCHSPASFGGGTVGTVVVVRNYTVWKANPEQRMNRITITTQPKGMRSTAKKSS
jgi:hypothetical protein